MGTGAVRALIRKARQALWALNGILGSQVAVAPPHKATVLITYFSPARATHIEPQIRNILKCSFVERVIVSSHNPALGFESLARCRDPRLTCVRQSVARGCGYRWQVAAEYDPEYLIVVDDDLQLFSWQLARLFEHLVAEPSVPHGLAGMLLEADKQLRYQERRETPVDFLCEIYAVTRDHLRKFQQLRALLAANKTLADIVESMGDFVVISSAGSGRPKIHDVGRVFRCPTFNQQGIAVHKDKGFEQKILQLAAVVNDIRSHLGERDSAAAILK